MGNFSEIEGDENDRPNVVFAPGNAVGFFSIGPLNFGLEICLDHNIGVLRAMAAKHGINNVHVHLIVSAFVGQDLSHAAPGAQVLLHASSHPIEANAAAASTNDVTMADGRKRGTVGKLLERLPDKPRDFLTKKWEKVNSYEAPSTRSRSRRPYCRAKSASPTICIRYIYRRRRGRGIEKA